MDIIVTEEVIVTKEKTLKIPDMEEVFRDNVLSETKCAINLVSEDACKDIACSECAFYKGNAKYLTI